MASQSPPHSPGMPQQVSQSPVREGDYSLKWIAAAKFAQMAPLDHVFLTNPDSQAIRARPCVEDPAPLLLK